MVGPRVQCRKSQKTNSGFQLLQVSMEVQEFNLGTTPPMFGLQGSYWSMEGKQVVIRLLLVCYIEIWIQILLFLALLM